MSSAPKAPPPVKAPDPIPTAPDPEPTPESPVINETSAKKQNDGETQVAKKKGTNSLIIPLSAPSNLSAIGNGLKISR